MRVSTVAWNGDGVDSRSISGVGFQPELVILFRDDSGVSNYWRTSAFTGDLAINMGQGGTFADIIQAFETDGFQVGVNANANVLNGSYMAACFLDNGIGGRLAVGTYSGNATDSRNIVITPSFQPNFVVVKGNDAGLDAAWRSSAAHSTDDSEHFRETAAGADRIQAINSDGFQVGLNADVNASGTAYYYMAMGTAGGNFAIGTYSGNNTDDRNITGIGFQPILAIADNITTETALSWAKLDRSVTADAHNFGGGGADSTDAIQALQSDGFQVGLAAGVNENLSVIAWFAWIDSLGGKSGLMYKYWG